MRGLAILNIAFVLAILKYLILILIVTLLGISVYFGYQYYLASQIKTAVQDTGHPFTRIGKIVQASDLNLPECINYFLASDAGNARLVSNVLDEGFNTGPSIFTKYKYAEVEVSGELTNIKNTDTCRGLAETECNCNDIITLDPEADIKVIKEGKSVATRYEGDLYCQIGGDNKEGRLCAVYGLRTAAGKEYYLNFLSKTGTGARDELIGTKVRVLGIVNRIVMDVLEIEKVD